MLTINLGGAWRMKRTDWQEWIPAVVPGTVLKDLLDNGKIEDPFYRENEYEGRELASYDYEYERSFTAGRDLLDMDRVVLRCEGLDTLAEIDLNGSRVASTDNMHRTYEFDVKSLLVAGENTIHVTFRSPVKYIQKKQEESPLWGVDGTITGFPHLRKGHYMFGWDWGPQLPDAGIWRAISLKGYTDARLDDVYVTQKHSGSRVSLDVRVRCLNWSGKAIDIKVTVAAPSGKKLEKTISTCSYEEHIAIDVEDPELWWPNGLGAQPLYGVKVEIVKNNIILDEQSFNIGLRTINIRREKDQWGESFEFVVNGVPVFAMGADYIPEDNLLTRVTPERTERLIEDCVEANFNAIRVWGGGVYPEDWFFDLCDKYGLIVWQDFMFACAVYEMTDEFAENIRREAEDNIRRIRHHASLGLWCGNNEMEMAWVDWGLPKSAKLKTDYIKQFEILLPQVVKENDPNTFYWPASPSSGGGFDAPNDENRGDVHYWSVWHGRAPFTDFRKYHFRFASEFGMQSFPSMKTVESFTLPEDRNIFSYVMENHQKSPSGNEKILFYISDYLKYPKDLDSLIYASQVLQGEAIKYGVEHWRRNRGRCMGSIYWQLNDCWPVASWASIDSFYRWKALHYFAKRFYAPVLLSANEEGTEVSLHVTNDTMNPVKGIVTWKLMNNKSEVLREGSSEVEASPLSAVMVEKLDFADLLPTRHERRKTYLEFVLEVDGKPVSSGTVMFVRAKHFDFLKPDISAAISEFEDRFEITLKAAAFAKYVELELIDADGVFSDNYFDLTGGAEKKVELRKDRLSRALSLGELEKALKIRSLVDMYE